MNIVQNNHKTLIILDWDDTLFPTSWVMKNNIDVQDENNKQKYLMLFSQLDNLLFNLLTKFLTYGDVIIVTNAMTKWVYMSCNVLPYTLKLINKKVTVISARDIYSKHIPDGIKHWKTHIFKGVVNDFYDEAKVHHVENVISIGDAEYELDALIDLYNDHHVDRTRKRVLKSVQLIRYPTYEVLLDQLDTLYKCSHKIVKSKKHMDLKFKNND